MLKKTGEEVVVSTSGHLASLPSYNDDKGTLACCGHAEISNCGVFVAYTFNLLCSKTTTTIYVAQKQAHGPSGDSYCRTEPKRRVRGLVVAP
jgi:hypothetical protein